MIFDDVSISRLRSAIKTFLSDKRYTHTLGVEEMAYNIGNIIIPEQTDELRVAALLHDITKELPYEKHISIIKKSNVFCTEEDIQTSQALHSITAAPFILEHFSEYATQDVLSAVSNHTLGADDMSVFDEIIFLADYAESGRTYRSCSDVRAYLNGNVSNLNTIETNIHALHKASLMAINFTIDSLNQRGCRINTKTFSAQRYFERIAFKQ